MIGTRSFFCNVILEATTGQVCPEEHTFLRQRRRDSNTPEEYEQDHNENG